MTILLIMLMALAIIFILHKKSPGRLMFAGKEVVYADDSRYPNAKKTVIANQGLGIRGKPDYILKTKSGQFVPVELKSGVNNGNVYPNDRMQLAAYIALAEANFGEVPYGEIRYRNRTVVIRNTSKLMQELKITIGRINYYKKSKKAPSVLGFSEKCRHCDCYKTVCKL